MLVTVTCGGGSHGNSQTVSIGIGHRFNFSQEQKQRDDGTLRTPLVRTVIHLTRSSSQQGLGNDASTSDV